MTDDDPDDVPVEDLKRRYAQERYYLNDRGAAEYAYVLAVLLRDAGELQPARRFATECLMLARQLPSTTLEDVVVHRQKLGGVLLPEHFHDQVVRSRLADLLAD